MRAYSMDLRERVIASLDEGESSLEVAARLGVHDSWVRKLRRRRDRTGTIAPAPHGGGRERKLDPRCEQALRAALDARNDATLEELRQALANNGKHVSITSVWRALARLGITLKKNSARHGA
jgi:transposase